MQVHLARCLLAFRIRTLHRHIVTVLLNMNTDMAPREEFLASIFGEGTSRSDIVAHVDQQTGRIQKDIPSGRTASRAIKVVSAGGKTGNRRDEALVTKDMVALQSDRTDKGTVADWAHKMGVVGRDVFKSAEIDRAIEVRLHHEELGEVHGGMYSGLMSDVCDGTIR